MDAGEVRRAAKWQCCGPHGCRPVGTSRRHPLGQRRLHVAGRGRRQGLCAGRLRGAVGYRLGYPAGCLAVRFPGRPAQRQQCLLAGLRESPDPLRHDGRGLLCARRDGRQGRQPHRMWRADLQRSGGGPGSGLLRHARLARARGYPGGRTDLELGLRPRRARVHRRSLERRGLEEAQRPGHLARAVLLHAGHRVARANFGSAGGWSGRLAGGRGSTSTCARHLSGKPRKPGHARAEYRRVGGCLPPVDSTRQLRPRGSAAVP